MIIVEPIAIGDVACTRASPKRVYDRTGILTEVPSNVLGVTYDPSDLSKAPYALIEPEGRNLLRYSEQFDNVGAWGRQGGITLEPGAALAPNGQMAMMQLKEGQTTGPYITQTAAVELGDQLALSVYAKLGPGGRGLALIFTGPTVAVNQIVSFDLESLEVTTISGSSAWRVEPLPNALVRCTIIFTAIVSGFVAVQIRPTLNGSITYTGDGVSGNYIFGAMLANRGPSSYIKTEDAPVTRAADVIGAGAGLVYSNAPIIEPAYDAKVTYAKDAKAHDPATYEVFQSLIAGNVGKPLSDTGAWAPRGIVNRRAMFDDYNNTQTVLPDEILVVLTPEMVAQGLYLGNLDVHELRLSMVDAIDGVVYSEVISLIESNSQSSYFNWMFKRIKRRTYFFVLDMPVYANALVTISLRKIGAEAKAGMCAIGPVEEFGPSLLGLSTEGKDFSSTTFNFDGTSKTTLRPYAKRMSCDVVVSNNEITYVQDRLFELRQRPLVWVGGPYGATAVFGRYGSFKNVIEYQMQSKMSLTIEGAV